MIESRPGYQFGIPPFEEHWVRQVKCLSDFAVLVELLAAGDGDAVEDEELSNIRWVPTRS